MNGKGGTCANRGLAPHLICGLPFHFLVHLEECGVCLDCSKEHWLFSQ